MLRRLPTVLFGAAMVASGALLLAFATQLTFLGDSWELLVRRPGLSADALLDPFHEHLILAPAAIYELLLAIFGMDSALPFFVVSLGLFLTGVALLYACLRPRLGDWLALAACLPVLFLGAASEDLLWEFQMTFFGSVAAGLGMLLALEREDRRSDRIACLLLCVSMSFSGVGLAFAAAALADLLFGRRPRRSRAYVALLPLAAYLLWWAIWGQAGGGGGIDDATQLPRDVFDAIAAGLSSLLGRSPVVSGGHPPLLAQLLLVVLLAVAAARIWRSRPLPRSLIVAVTVAFAYWSLISLDQGLTRDPTASRYQYPSAVFILLLAGELVGRPPRSRPILAAAAAVSAVAVAGGLSMLRHEYEDFWRPTAEDTRAVLAAVDLAGDSASSSRPLRLPVAAPDFNASIGEYESARARYGTPAYSEAELMRRSNRERQFADRTMADVLALRLKPIEDKASRRCRPLVSGESTALPSGRYELRSPGGNPVLHLGRFADDFPVELGDLPAGETRALAIPVDRARRMWKLTTESPLRICG
ncbi:MAG: hypothetical protein M3Y75_13980 [Actinomycetota bacterium]|nr:hypothetical protein [Actinomycetota bacterium]